LLRFIPILKGGIPVVATGLFFEVFIVIL